VGASDVRVTLPDGTSERLSPGCSAMRDSGTSSTASMSNPMIIAWISKIDPITQLYLP